MKIIESYKSSKQLSDHSKYIVESSVYAAERRIFDFTNGSNLDKAKRYIGMLSRCYCTQGIRGDLTLFNYDDIVKVISIDECE